MFEHTWGGSEGLVVEVGAPFLVEPMLPTMSVHVPDYTWRHC